MTDDARGTVHRAVGGRDPGVTRRRYRFRPPRRPPASRTPIAARGDDGTWLSTVPRDQLMAAAEEIETRPGARTLPLYGVPFGVKDSIDVEGVPTTLSCPDFAYVASTTAPVVRRLPRRGARYTSARRTWTSSPPDSTATRTPYTIPRSVYGGEMISGGSSSGSALTGRAWPGAVRGGHRHRRLRPGACRAQRGRRVQTLARADQHRRAGPGMQVAGLHQRDGRLDRRCRPRLRRRRRPRRQRSVGRGSADRATTVHRSGSDCRP